MPRTWCRRLSCWLSAACERFRGRTASEWRHWLRSILIRNMAQERRRFAATAKRQVQREVAVPEEMQLEYPGYIETPSRDLALRELEAALIEGLERSAGALSGGRHLAPTRGPLVRGDRPAAEGSARRRPASSGRGHWLSYGRNSVRPMIHDEPLTQIRTPLDRRARLAAAAARIVCPDDDSVE